MKIKHEKLFWQWIFGVMRTRIADRHNKFSLTNEPPYRLRVSKIVLCEFETQEEENGFAQRLLELPLVNIRMPQKELQRQILESMANFFEKK